MFINSLYICVHLNIYRSTLKNIEYGVIPPQITQKSAKLHSSYPDFNESIYM